MIESRNFIPEALMIQQIQESKRAEIDCNSFLKVTRRLVAGLESELWKMEVNFSTQKFLSLADEDEGDSDEEDWDEEDEDSDEEDEDWDEEDEDRDEEDEDWDDEDDLDEDDDDEEDWDEDEEEE